jgi:hypothetical protein
MKRNINIVEQYKQSHDSLRQERRMITSNNRYGGLRGDIVESEYFNSGSSMNPTNMSGAGIGQ